MEGHGGATPEPGNLGMFGHAPGAPEREDNHRTLGLNYAIIIFGLSQEL